MIYAIGDVHGCHDQLLVLLAKIKRHAGAAPYTGIFLGDYVDRGPKSREVVNQVRGLVTGKGGFGTWKALKGNHEEMMFEATSGSHHPDHWVMNGGGATAASYAGHDASVMAKDAVWLNNLPTYIETDNYVFVHAGLSPRYSIAEQPDEVRLWIRNWQGDDPDFGKHVVYGHTPAKTPFLLNNSTGLDTGAVYWGTLTCGVFDETKAGGPVEILQAT